MKTRMLFGWLFAGCLLAFAGVGLQAQEKKEEKKKAEVKKQVPNEPFQRMDKGAVVRHENFVKRAKEGNVDVLFVGDSITQGWEGNGKDVWKENYGKLKAANFGIGGDRTEHVLWRITEGKELEGISPKVCVLMIGTNNAGANSSADIAGGVKAIVAELNKQRPEMKVLVLGVFPRAVKGFPKDVIKIESKDLHPKMKEINDIIEKLADNKKVFYMDISKSFLEADGSLTREVMPDYLHLSQKGYEAWAAAIKDKLATLLK